MGNFIAYLEDKIVKCEKEVKELILSERKDEANLIKVKNNIYGVCKITYEVIVKNHKSEEVNEKYLAKLDHLSQTWNQAYGKAKEFHDVDKIVVEETKLQVLKEVIAYFKAEI